MNRRYKTLTLFTAIAIIFRTALVELHNPHPQSVKLSNLGDDAESRLATGRRFSFVKSDLYELTLLSGISDRLALRMLERKAQICLAAIKLPLTRQAEAFIIVPGIGKKTAQKLSQFLDLSECTSVQY